MPDRHQTATADRSRVPLLAVIGLSLAALPSYLWVGSSVVDDDAHGDGWAARIAVERAGHDVEPEPGVLVVRNAP